MTFAELRSLSRASITDPDAREVLHDALLEIFPEETERWIARAEAWASTGRGGVRFVVAFSPEAAEDREQSGAMRLPFDIYQFYPSDFDPDNPDGWLAVMRSTPLHGIVYITNPRSKVRSR